MPSLPTTDFWGNSLPRYFPSALQPATPFQQFRAYYRVSFLPICLASLLLLWPIGIGSSPGGGMTVGEGSYIVFQAIYVGICLPVMILFYEMGVWHVPWWVNAVTFLLSELAALIFFVAVGGHLPQTRLGLTRALGPVFGSLFISVGYLLYGVFRFRLGEKKSSADESALDDALTGTESNLTMMRDPQTADLASPGQSGEPAPSAARTEWNPQLMLFGFLQLCCVTCVYFFCQWYTEQFFTAREPSPSASVGLAAGFIGTLEVFSFISKRVGRFQDRLRASAGSGSGEIAAEIATSCFYCVFYRSLFQEVSNWVEFVGICVAHIAVHALIYPFRMTDFYYRLSARVIAVVKVCLPFVDDNSTPDEWRLRMSIDFAIRAVALFGSSVSYIVSVLFARYGYNGEHYAFFNSELSDGAFSRLMIFQALSAGVEVLSVLTTVIATKRFVPGGILAPCATLFESHPTYEVFFIVTAAHITTDVALARLVLWSATAPASQ